MADVLTGAAETGAAYPPRGVSRGRLDPAEETSSAHTPAPPVAVWVWRPGVDSGAATGTWGHSFGHLQPAGDTEVAPRAQPVSVLALPVAAEVDLALPTTPVVSDAAWTEAIADQERVPVFELRADWSRSGNYDHPCSDLTGLVEGVTVTRELAGELPAEVGLVEGYAAAKLAATLSGQWPGTETDPVEAFAPYRRDAALYGTPVIGSPIEFYSGFNTREGPQTRRQFTGSVSRVSPSSSARDVQLDGVDPANMLRAPITLPAVALDSVLLDRYGPDRYNHRFNSQWLVDHILRRNGFHASPPAHPDAFVSATLHGSSVPERGSGGVPRYVTDVGAGMSMPQVRTAWTSEGHPFGMLAPHPMAHTMSGQWRTEWPVTFAPGTGIGFSAWMRLPSVAQRNGLFSLYPSEGFDCWLSIEIDSAGGPLLAPGANAGDYPELGVTGYQAPSTPTWKFVGGHFGFRNGLVDLTLRVDGRTYRATGQQFRVPSTVQWAVSTAVDYGLEVPCTNVQFWSAPAPPTDWLGETWIPQADIDPGLNELTGIPGLVNEDSWKLLCEVAAAEFGAVGFDPDGRPWFRSRAVQRPPQEREVITARRTLADMTTTIDEASVRNSVSAAATQLLVGDYEWVFESKDVHQFESGPGRSTFDIPLPPDTVLVDYTSVAHFSGDSQRWRDLTAEHRYRTYLCVMSVAHEKPTEVFPFGVLSLWAYRKDPATLTVVIDNPSNKTVRFQTPDVVDSNGNRTAGAPAFKVPGRRLKQAATDPRLLRDPGSIALYGERTYDLGGRSRWHQYPPAIAGVSAAVLGALGHPVPALESVEVPHDPRRNLYDDVLLTDEEGLGTVPAAISGIRTKYSSGGALDTLTVRPLAPPGLGLWDDPHLGQVGQTLVFGP